MNLSHQRGILPLSADPVTLGHLDIIRRAAARCSELIVLVCDNDRKRGAYLFELNERTEMMERAIRLSNLPNVRVSTGDRLLADIFLKEGCDALFRGIRNQADRDEEERQMRYHALIWPELTSKVVYLEADTALQDISSSLVKAFTAHAIDVSPFVPVFVKAALEERICRQWKIGLTGQIASGKSWVAERLAKELRRRGCAAHVVSFDRLLRELYIETSPGAALVREELARLCGDGVLTSDRTQINREALSRRLFDPQTPDALRQATHTLTAPHVMRLYREALRGKCGVVLIEWAQLAEMDMGPVVNHRSIVVDSPDRQVNAHERGLEPATLERLSAFQWTADKKAAALKEQASLDGGGLVIRFKNVRESTGAPSNAVAALADELLRTIPPSIRSAGDPQ